MRRIFLTMMGACLVAPLHAQTTTYSQRVDTFGRENSYSYQVGRGGGLNEYVNDDRNGSGWRREINEYFWGGNPYSHLDFSVHGMTVSYAANESREYWKLDNVAELTGSGRQADRYISVSIGDMNFYGLEGTAYTWSFNDIDFAGGLYLEAGEHMEIRWSLDNFSETLLRWDGDGIRDRLPNEVSDLLVQTVFPADEEPTSNFQALYTIRAADHLQGVQSPIEFQIYYWYDADYNAAASDGTPSSVYGSMDMGHVIFYSIDTVSVPEPSMTLLGLGGAVIALRRRRRTA